MRGGKGDTALARTTHQQQRGEAHVDADGAGLGELGHAVREADERERLRRVGAQRARDEAQHEQRRDEVLAAHLRAARDAGARDAVVVARELRAALDLGRAAQHRVQQHAEARELGKEGRNSEKSATGRARSSSGSGGAGLHSRCSCGDRSLLVPLLEHLERGAEVRLVHAWQHRIAVQEKDGLVDCDGWGEAEKSACA